MRRSEYNLGVGGTGQGSREPFDVITPPGSTEHGGMDILTPPGSTQQGGLEPITPPEKKDMNSPYKDIFQQLFMKALAEEEEREKERRQ